MIGLIIEKDGTQYKLIAPQGLSREEFAYNTRIVLDFLNDGSVIVREYTEEDASLDEL